MKPSPRQFWIAGSVSLSCLVASYPTSAQIVPDGTLPVNSTVTQQGTTTIIEGGTRAGGNLFHSFDAFSVPTGGTAYFNNALDVNNILSRVTGRSISNIDGLIRANGTANLFLLNPNGIIFGPNARLNIGGSFLASTASSFQFADGSFFSAIPAQTTPLLTISVPVGLQYGGNAAEIRVQGAGQTAGLNGILQSFDSATVLGVNPGNTLAIAGGNVIVDGGVLQALGGRVELGGLAGAGTVTINPDFSLTFPEGVARADVLLTNRAGVNVIGGANGGGSIAIQAANIGLSGDSLLTSGLALDLGRVNTRAGDIALDATYTTTIDRSRIENNVNRGTTGDSGNIDIQTGSFFLTNFAALDTTNFESGLAGDISVTASNQISITNQGTISSDGEYGRIFLSAINGSVLLDQATISTTNSGSGFAGDITIDARDRIAITDSTISSQGNFGTISIGSQLETDQGIVFAPALVTIDGITTELTTDNKIVPTADAGFIDIAAATVAINDATLNSSTFGTGKAGDISIESSGSVALANSLLKTNVEPGAEGNAGTIKILAGDVSMTNGAVLDSSSFGMGNAGNINIQAPNGSVFIAGDGTTIFSTVEPEADGNAGNISIDAGAILIAEGATLTSNNLASGSAGNISLIALGPLSLIDSSLTSTSNSDNTAFGDISVIATQGSVFLERAKLNTTNTGSGFAGDIILDAGDRIAITDSTISSQGNFGTISIGSQQETEQGTFFSPTWVTIDGTTTELTTDNKTAPDKNAGSIAITAANVEINQAKLSSSTFGTGKAGDISVIASDSIFLAGNQVLTNVEAGATGQGGNININAGSLTLTDGARLETSVLGPSEEVTVGGNATAGNVSIDVLGKVTLTNGSAIVSNLNEGAEGNAGSINILATDFWMTDGAILDSSSFGIGNAGSISLKAPNGSVFIAGDGTTIFTTVEREADGNAGNISIDAGAILIAEGAKLTSDNNSSGAAGNISLNATGPLSLVNSSISSTSNNYDFDGFGNIRLATTTGSLVLNQAQLSTTNTGSQFAGDIILNAGNQILITNGSNITSDGNVGRILIGQSDISGETSSPRVVIVDSSTLSTTNAAVIGDGDIDAGEISIDAIDNISLVNGSILQAFTERQGNAGTISIAAGSFSMTDGSQLDSSSFGIGNAGTIDVQVPDGSVFLSGDSTRIFSTVEGFGTGSGGSINITARSLVLKDGAELQTLLRTQQEDPTGERTAGNINITTSEDVTFIGSKAFSNVAQDAIGDAGSLTITARSIFITDSAELNTNNPNSVLAGKITLNATDQVSLVNSVITSQTNNDNLRDEDVSSIRIAASEGSIFLTNSELNTTNKGSGFAGDIILNASDQISIANGSKLSSNGNFGRILIGNTGIFPETYSPRAVTLDNSTLNTTNAASTSDVPVDAGAIIINALESVSLRNQSFINAFTQRLGNAGNVIVQVENGGISLTDGSTIFNTVEAGGIGNGGNVNLRARSLSLTGGAQMQTTISSQEPDPTGTRVAGDINIEADDVSLEGISDIDFLASAIFSNVRENAIGNAGSVRIKARTLSVRDRGLISVNNEGDRGAGNINITADSVQLDTGTLSATTQAGQGNITINSSGLILRRGSKIVTDASGNETGGNIIINTQVLAALENSDITANAFEGKGGNVTINTQGIFGTAFRETPTPESDITATGASSELSGTVEINTPDVDPSQGLVALPVQILDTENQIAQGCAAGKRNEFSVTGRGGLPPIPSDALGDNTTWTDFRTPTGNEPRSRRGDRENNQSPTSQTSLPREAAEIVEAQGWTLNDKGEVMLTATTSTATPHRSGFFSSDCQHLSTTQN